MPNTHTSLVSLFEDIADAIRAKTGGSASIVADNFPTEIANIPAGGGGISIDDVAQKTLSGALTSSTVSSVAEGAFQQYDNITSVNFPNCTDVGSYAFMSCDALSSVSLSSCTTISSGAFQSCSSLSSISIPSITTIGSYAFQNTGITSLSISGTVSLGVCAFQNCASLQSIYLPNVTSITSSVFKGCSSLTTLSAQSLSYIGGSTFNACTSLVSVVLPSAGCFGNNYYETGAFSGCSNLTTVDIGGGTYHSGSSPLIGKSAFASCTSLRTFIIRWDYVVPVATNAFYNTPIESLDPDAHIYVPASLVSSYQSDANWSTFSSIISAIPNS